jgi:hypothetical protein
MTCNKEANFCQRSLVNIARDLFVGSKGREFLSGIFRLGSQARNLSARNLWLESQKDNSFQGNDRATRKAVPARNLGLRSFEKAFRTEIVG